MKRCRKCCVEKPEAEFSRLSASKDGFDLWCRACKAASFKAWRERNRASNNAKKLKYMKQLAEERKAAGLCPRCGKEPRPGRVVCQVCSKRTPDALRTLKVRADQRKSIGLCAACRKPSDGRRYCPECRRKRAEAFQALQSQRITSGVCWKCGKYKAEPGYTLCCECKAMLNECSRRWSGRRESKKRIALALKLEVFAGYGGARCACCGEDTIEFLSIDHINGGGCKHLKEIGGPGRLYYWLRANGYPTGFQVLCFNCNTGKRRNGGQCPHHGTMAPRSSAQFRRDRIRDEAFAAYGGYRCVCCGEQMKQFLELDHIAGNSAGAKDRKRHGMGTSFYVWLKEAGYPAGLQVMCANCNRSKAVNEVCAHTRSEVLA